MHTLEFCVEGVNHQDCRNKALEVIEAFDPDLDTFTLTFHFSSGGVRRFQDSTPLLWEAAVTVGFE